MVPYYFVFNGWRLMLTRRTPIILSSNTNSNVICDVMDTFHSLRLFVVFYVSTKILTHDRFPIILHTALTLTPRSLPTVTDKLAYDLGKKAFSLDQSHTTLRSLSWVLDCPCNMKKLGLSCVTRSRILFINWRVICAYVYKNISRFHYND